METERAYRLGVDIGGTFTDLVLLGADGTIVTHKVLSTPDDYGRAIVTAINDLTTRAGSSPSASPRWSTAPPFARMPSSKAKVRAPV
jgi:N-methylhydantoinase A/oxoprolinase/acetone carboxylase beta subunit